jgi:hypothetical protein
MSPYRILSIGFPIYLLLFEAVVRLLFKVDISSFIGPSLAAGGLGLLIEGTKPKKIADATIVGITLPQNFVVRNIKDERLVLVAWGLILVCIVAWLYSCVSSIKAPVEISGTFTLPKTQSKEIIDSLQQIHSDTTSIAQNGTTNSNEKTNGILSWSFALGILNYLCGTIFLTVKGGE